MTQMQPKSLVKLHLFPIYLPCFGTLITRCLASYNLLYYFPLLNRKGQKREHHRENVWILFQSWKGVSAHFLFLCRDLSQQNQLQTLQNSKWQVRNLNRKLLWCSHSTPHPSPTLYRNPSSEPQVTSWPSHTHTHAQTHVHTHAHTHARIHTHSHACTHATNTYRLLILQNLHI